MYESEPGTVLEISRPEHVAMVRDLAPVLQCFEDRLPDLDIVFAGPVIDGLRTGTSCSARQPLWVLGADSDAVQAVRRSITEAGMDPGQFRVIPADRFVTHYSHRRATTDHAAFYMFQFPETTALLGQDDHGRVMTPRIKVSRDLTAIAHALGLAADADRARSRRFGRTNRTALETLRNRAFLQAVTILGELDRDQVTDELAALELGPLGFARDLINKWVARREVNTAAQWLPTGDAAMQEVLVAAWRNAQVAVTRIDHRLTNQAVRSPKAGYHRPRLTGLETPADEPTEPSRRNAGSAETNEMTSSGIPEPRNAMYSPSDPHQADTAVVHDLDAFRAARDRHKTHEHLDR